MKRVIALLFLSLIPIFVLAQRTEGTANAHLSGRNLVGTLPRPTYNAQLEGTVVVQVKVDQYGNVTEAIPGVEGTTVTDSGLWNVARNAAMKVHFNAKADAPVVQTGTITYTFFAPSESRDDTITYTSESSGNNSDENSLKFMGVPIDGPKEQMYDALMAKGFEKESFYDYMTGVFNGEDVKLYLSTNHGIVDRIKVVYPYCNEANDTRVKYNTLLSRFNRNAKYVCVNPRVEVPLDEKIYWKLDANSKYYDAIYFFLRPEINANEWVAEFKQEYQKRNHKPLEGLSYEEMEEALFSLPMRVSAAISGIVWFTMVNIHQININYVNLNNRPHGEDL